MLSFGDLSQIPLEHLSSFVDDVVDGILSHGDNFSSWPTVVSGDVRSHVHKLKSEVYEVSGSVKGKLIIYVRF
jgi:dynein heavy chain